MMGTLFEHHNKGGLKLSVAMFHETVNHSYTMLLSAPDIFICPLATVFLIEIAKFWWANQVGCTKRCWCIRIFVYTYSIRTLVRLLEIHNLYIFHV